MDPARHVSPGKTVPTAGPEQLAALVKEQQRHEEEKKSFFDVLCSKLLFCCNNNREGQPPPQRDIQQRQPGDRSLALGGGDPGAAQKASELQNKVSALMNKVDEMTLANQQNQAARLVLVIGATGRQGGSVMRHLLARGVFRVRALTRYPESKRGMRLREQGAEVVQGDLTDVESLGRAMAGCHGVFCMTNYGEGMDYDLEVQQGCNAVDAAARAGVQHFILSSLENVLEVSEGRIAGARHFDSKAAIEKHLLASGVGYTVVRPSFYYENFLDPTYWKVTPDGVLVISLPMSNKPFYMFSAEDLGGIVAPLFEPAQAPAYLGRVLGVAGDYLTGPHIVRIFMKVTGKATRYEAVPYSALKKANIPGGSERADMFRFFQEHPLQREIAECRKLYPQLMTWEKWLRKSLFDGPPKEKLPLRV